uniref:ATP-dependent DNA helicase n=1 Tax=Manihot esculenta TaxID=3983 RepID=A0A2C9UZ96_MANES
MDVNLYPISIAMDYNLPLLDPSLFPNINNRLLLEKLNYDTEKLKINHDRMITNLNLEQSTIYNEVLTSVNNNDERLFFVYGHGGTEKTYLYETILSRLRSEWLIILVVASSGICSLLLSGGRIVHSRFKISIEIDKNSTCDIKKGTQLAALKRETFLIIWDETPMNHRHCFEAVDRTLRDILENNSIENDKFFGEKLYYLVEILDKYCRWL